MQRATVPPAPALFFTNQISQAMSRGKEKEIKPREDVNPEEGIHKYGT
jgi:hypothetical protein